MYEWEASTGKRVGESVLKSCSYTSVTVTPDGKNTFAVGSDKTLKEVVDSAVSAYALNLHIYLLYFVLKNSVDIHRP